MFKIVYRYLAINFILPFTVSMIFFVSFLLITQLFRIIRMVVSKGVELSVILELMGHIAISFVPAAVPLSIFFAAIFTLNKLSEDSEIIAMRSFGFTKFQLFLPFLIQGILIGIAIFSLNQNLIPYSQRKFTNGFVQLASKGLLADIKAEQFFTQIPNVTLFAEKVEEKGRKLQDVYIRVKDENKAEERIIMAQKGIMIKHAEDAMSSAAVRLRLTKGNIVKTKDGEQDVEKLLFEEYDFPLMSGEYEANFVTKDRMRTSGELWELINSERSPDELRRTKLEFWSRINTPIQCLIFILLGFSLGIKKGRGSSGSTGVWGFIIIILYYAIMFGGISMAKKGTIDPAVAIFLPTILGLFAGRYLYRRLDWVS